MTDNQQAIPARSEKSAVILVLDRIVAGMAVCAGVIFVGALVLVLVEITSRYFFRSPILGAVEATEYCLLWITFLGAAWVQGRNGNVRVDFLVNALQPRRRAMVMAIGSLVSAAACLVIAVFGVVAVWDQYDIGYQLSTPLRPSGALIISVIPLGCFFLAIQFVRQFFSYWSGTK